MLPWLALTGGISLAKYFSDRNKENADNQLRASELQYAPYTHRGPQTEVHRADLVGNLAGGLGSGLAMGQNQAAFDKNSEYTDALLARIKGGAPLGVTAGGPSLGGYGAGANPFGLDQSAWMGMGR